jgi:hypothetical protein
MRQKRPIGIFSFRSVSMNTWNDDYARELMTSSAEVLVNFSVELKRKLADQDQDQASSADEALLLLRQITSFSESMTRLAEKTKLSTH